MADNKIGNNLSASIVQRFMTDEEWAEFKKEYASSRYNGGGGTRERTLSEEITEQELDILKSYLQDTDTTVTKLAEQNNTNNYKIDYSAKRTALKVLYQNPRFLTRL